VHITKNFLPENRQGIVRMLSRAEIDDSFISWLEQQNETRWLKIRDAKNGHQFALVSSFGNPFPGDTTQSGKPMNTLIYLNGDFSENLNSQNIVDEVVSAVNNGEEIFASIEHCLESDNPIRKITISISRSPIVSYARKMQLDLDKITLTSDNLSVVGGSFVFGDYQWGHPEVDENGATSENGD